MKLIIIEGPDNCGKNTLIEGISNTFDFVKIIHCGRPQGSTNLEKIKYQETFFKHLSEVGMLDNQLDKIAKFTDATIHNRSWYGEYVYGVIYRNTPKWDIEKLILQIENNLIKSMGNSNIYYIQLMSSSSELLANNDDDLSLSDGNIKLIDKECKLFTEIFNKSTLLNKHMLFVNNASGEFRPKEEILDEALRFINK